MMELFLAGLFTTAAMAWAIWQWRIGEIYSYLAFRKGIQIWVNRMDYQVSISEEGIRASICRNVFQWRWDQVELQSKSAFDSIQTIVPIWKIEKGNIRA